MGLGQNKRAAARVEYELKTGPFQRKGKLAVPVR